MRSIWLAVGLSCAALAGSALAVEPRATCPKNDAPDYFFEAGFFDRDPRNDEFTRDWYSKHLSAMKVASLSCGKQAATEIYRFLWLRTFDQPASVQIIKMDAVVRVETTILSGAGGYEPGDISRRISRRLSLEEWRRFAAALSSSSYWSLPTEDGWSGFDGAQWIIEARRDGVYHLVERWSPESGPVRELGLLFIEFGGLVPIFGKRVY